MKCIRLKIFMVLLVGQLSYVFCATNNRALEHMKPLEFNSSDDTLIYAHVVSENIKIIHCRRCNFDTLFFFSHTICYFYEF